MTKKEWVTVPCPKSTAQEVVQEESSLYSFKGKETWLLYSLAESKDFC